MKYNSYLQSPDEAVKEFMEQDPILTEIEARIKFYIVSTNKIIRKQPTPCYPVKKQKKKHTHQTSS